MLIANPWQRSVELDTLHCENLVTCIEFNGNNSNPPIVEIRNAIGNAGVTNFVDILTGPPTGNVVISTYTNNATSCAVIRFGSCVQTGANIILPTSTKPSRGSFGRPYFA